MSNIAGPIDLSTVDGRQRQEIEELCEWNGANELRSSRRTGRAVMSGILDELGALIYKDLQGGHEKLLKSNSFVQELLCRAAAERREREALRRAALSPVDRWIEDAQAVLRRKLRRDKERLTECRVRLGRWIAGVGPYRYGGDDW